MKYGWVVLTWLLLASCGGDSTDGGVKDCSLEEKNRFVYDNLHDSYFWYWAVPVADYATYSSPSRLLKDLKYDRLDQWSYTTTTAAYEQYFEAGTYIGHGFSMTRHDGELYIRFVYADSPAAAVLTRGQKVLAINGETLAEIDDQKLWNDIFQADEVGVQNRMTIEDNGLVKTVTLSKALVTQNTVLAEAILDRSGTQVGYLAFKGFIEPSRQELKQTFERFRQAEVEELVLDLRYNGGGRSSVARYLASLIAGNQVPAGSTFVNVRHNAKYRHWDERIHFDASVNGLNLDRVFVLTTDATCSASELIINGLRPFVDVYTIGETTCGKPVGMYSRDYCGLHLAMIEFEGLNADYGGGYYDGLAPTCEAKDDLSHAFGDPDETMLASALYLMEQDQCLPVAASQSVRNLNSNLSKPKLPSLLTGFRREVGAF